MGAARLFFFFFLFSNPRAGLATVLSSFFRVGNQCAEFDKQQQQLGTSDISKEKKRKKKRKKGHRQKTVVRQLRVAGGVPTYRRTIEQRAKDENEEKQNKRNARERRNHDGLQRIRGTSSKKARNESINDNKNKKKRQKKGRKTEKKVIKRVSRAQKERRREPTSKAGAWRMPVCMYGQSHIITKCRSTG